MRLPEYLGERGTIGEADHLRSGTLEVYESEWISIPAGTSAEFRHDLGEVPSVVEVDYSLDSTGSNPQPANTSYELWGSETWNPGTVNADDDTSTTITITGAAFGDFVMVSAPEDLQECVATAYVQAADTVEIHLANETPGNVTFTSGTWAVRILKPRAAEVRRVDSSATRGTELHTVTVTNNGTERRYFKVRAM